MNPARFPSLNRSRGNTICLYCFIVWIGLSALTAFRSGDAHTVPVGPVELLSSIKSGTCLACHQLGSLGTRKLPESLGKFPSSQAAWERRLQSGQAGGIMTTSLHNMGREALLKMFADWTDRIGAGELPPVPPRPKGIERNVVITQWDWADPKAYLHDLVSTDRRNPTVNANGALYGALEVSADYLPVLDPVRHAAGRVNVIACWNSK